MTHGFPERWSGAAFADFAVQWGAFELSIGGAFAPGRSHALGGEREIVVGLAGGRARGCYSFVQSASGARIGGCAVSVIAGLSGKGRGPASEVTGDSAVRAWWLFGAGPDVYLPLSPRMGLGISAAVLAQDKTEAFYISGAEGTYSTDAIAGWLGADLRAQIW